MKRTSLMLISLVVLGTMVASCAAPTAAPGAAKLAEPTKAPTIPPAPTQPPEAMSENPAACAGLKEKHASIVGSTIRVGMSTASPGYGVVDPNDSSKLLGIDPDMVAALADCLGFKFEYLALDFPGLVPALTANRIDIIYSAMYATPARAEQVNFIIYQKASTGSVVQKGMAGSIKSLDDICGKIASSVTGTVEAEQQGLHSEKCVAAGKPAIEMLLFKDNDAAVRAVQNKRADIFMTDAGLAGELSRQFADSLDLGFSIASEFRFGIGLNKDDPARTDALLEGVKVLQEAGIHAQLLEKWGFGSAALEPAALVTK